MARNTMKKSFSLKDELFNEAKVRYLAGLIGKADEQFKSEAFVRETVKGFKERELKERIVWIAQMLEKHLPHNFEETVPLLERSLPAPLDPGKKDNDFGDFIFAPYGEYLVRNGVSKKRLKRSLKALEAFTQRFSMEDAIRSFLNTYEEETFAALERWSVHPHYHVRRLASEGTRPFLPWSKRIGLSSEKAVELLDVLYADPTRYVTRSVANHLNDISKKDPALALETLARWKKEGKQETVEFAWMSKHALRTLIKKGDKKALAFLGHSALPKVEVRKFLLDPKSVTPGEALFFSFAIKASADESIIADYSIDFVKANGKSKAKVFKIKKMTVKKGETYLIEKKHKLVKDATTFTFYPGKHTLTLLINGEPYGSKGFTIR
jgi:3-methyladenine DNA glycosylase AlkC